jgi:pimeloyl-ACP methyl ester carboxylesterase
MITIDWCYSPTTPSEYEVFQNASAAVVQSWIDLSSPPGIVAHVSTKEVVQDYEMVRKALGYCKINFLGASYGSYRAQQYAFDFPDQVGHFVLDAVTPHALVRRIFALMFVPRHLY